MGTVDLLSRIPLRAYLQSPGVRFCPADGARRRFHPQLYRAADPENEIVSDPDQSKDQEAISKGAYLPGTSISDSYHEPHRVDQLTAQNVKTIASLEHSAQAQQSTADRVADRITRFCGSMPFVWVHVIWFAAWIAGNSLFLAKPIDPYPYSFLTLVVSLEAIFLSTFIMISENRQGRIDERRSHLDLQINLLAEQENTKTLKLLQAITRKLNVDPAGDTDVEVLEQATRPEKLIEQIDESIRESESGV